MCSIFFFFFFFVLMFFSTIIWVLNRTSARRRKRDKNPYRNNKLNKIEWKQTFAFAFNAKTFLFYFFFASVITRWTLSGPPSSSSSSTLCFFFFFVFKNYVSLFINISSFVLFDFGIFGFLFFSVESNRFVFLAFVIDERFDLQQHRRRVLIEVAQHEV